jgi:hypothetical protein
MASFFFQHPNPNQESSSLNCWVDYQKIVYIIKRAREGEKMAQEGRKKAMTAQGETMLAINRLLMPFLSLFKLCSR